MNMNVQKQNISSSTHIFYIRNTQGVPFAKVFAQSQALAFGMTVPGILSGLGAYFCSFAPVSSHYCDYGRCIGSKESGQI